ncbi:carboxylating nicotinate-nucleotide diphosphorylase [Legionella nagasakiensis]|uniref:carboxylating nicotinate-nucleotide diphosphorylase n=1 Tax=Legionella nagasakiensis TaxID=535290 RepID=UPI0010560B2D|nr:carboxylating nicotinate-nucleotide diphosphorylase [Legionella nagasakiensis]
MLPKQTDILTDVRRALAEDVGTGDVTAALLPEKLRISARIISREPMLMCGRPWVECVFAEINPEVEIHWLVKEGAWLDEPTTLCHLHGPARDVLTGERSALNFMQTLAATATQTRQCLLQLEGYSTRLLDTRKTLPGLRRAQKYAVACAGGVNHRFGLYDAFLIKENHIKACGSIKAAIALARKTGKGLLVEIEVETIAEFQEALAAGPDRILLDNFTPEMLMEAVAINKPKRCELEASGGIELSTLARIAETGVDYISIGAITKSIRAIDLSLLINES